MSRTIDKETMYGQKPSPDWKMKNLKLPGYRNALLIFKNVVTGGEKVYGFLLSPNQFSDQKAVDVQVNKTTVGWFLNRAGNSLGSLSLGGFFLDTRYVPERMTFLKRFMDVAEDFRNEKFELINDYLQKVQIEGVEYKGYIQNLQLSKNGQQPYLYQFSMSFIVYDYRPLSDATLGGEKIDADYIDVLSGAKKGSSRMASRSMDNDDIVELSNGLYNILKGGN